MRCGLKNLLAGVHPERLHQVLVPAEPSLPAAAGPGSDLLQPRDHPAVSTAAAAAVSGGGSGGLLEGGGACCTELDQHLKNGVQI